MNLLPLQRSLEHLAVLLEIRADRKERKREDELRLRLLAILALVLASEDWDAFRKSFLAELESEYSALDVNGEYGQLIDRELATQNGYLTGFIQDLKNGKLSDAQARNRAGMYAGSLGNLRERIAVAKDGDTLMTWRWDPTLEEERHCQDCRELDGQTRTGKQWASANLFPRSIALQCSYNCHCTLE